MRRAVQSWTAIGGLLGALLAIEAGSSGCGFLELRGDGLDGVGGEDGTGGHSNSSTTAAGTDASSTSAGGGGIAFSHPDQVFNELEVDGTFDSEISENKPIEIYSGTTTIINGKVNKAPADNDSLHFTVADDAVLRFDTFNANKNDYSCDNLHIRLNWLPNSSPTWNDPNSKSQTTDDDDKVGIGFPGSPANCSSMTYYLTRGRKLGLDISSAIANDASDSGYIVRIKSLPIRLERDIDKSVPLITDDDLTDKNEFSVAISGAASKNKPDEYKIELTNKAVRIEIVEGLSDSDYSCEDDDYDFILELPEFDPAASSDNSGRGACPMLDGFGPNPKVAALQDVTGKKTIHVSPVGSSVTPYTLIVSARPNKPYAP